MVGKKDNGGSFIALALEPGNLHRLRQSQPILLRIEDQFPDGIPKRLELMIAYSETPVMDARKLAQHAEVVLDERSAVMKRPHCPECRSTVEQFGMLTSDAPVNAIFCPTCGCILGIIPR